MPYKLIFPGSYRKREKEFLKKHSNLRDRYFKTLLLLEQNPMHHCLRATLTVTGNWLLPANPIAGLDPTAYYPVLGNTHDYRT